MLLQKRSNGMTDSIESISKRVSRNTEAVYGNGKNGLLTKVSILERNEKTKQDNL